MPGRNIGSLWTTKDGSNAALSGTIDFLGVQIRVAVFRNSNEKAKPNSPQYSIVSYGAENKQETTPNNAQQAASTQDNLPF